jgi:hypothetical protein
MSDDKGFVFLTPWLPMREGWYRIGFARGTVHRWRLAKVHEHNEATGDRWERWRMFYDVAVVPTGHDFAGAFDHGTELPATIRDRGHAGEIVEARWSDIVGPRTASKAKGGGSGKGK